MKILPKNEIYLDYAGATPIDKVVLKLMSLNSIYFGNPSAIHQSGTKAKKILVEARSQIAGLLGAHSDEIIFTSSGTESIALALLGLINNYQLLIADKKTIPHIVTTNIEHSAVLENCRYLEKTGQAQVTYIPINEKGIVEPQKIKKALKENTVLVTVMYANHEIGTIQPIREIAKEIRHFKKGKLKRTVLKRVSPRTVLRIPDFPFFHTDACQAMNYLETENIEKLGVDMLSFNSSKIYGPKGVGVLYKKRGVEISPSYMGGGQEFGLRSGTENVVSIMGIAQALEKVNKIKKKEIIRLTKIRDYGIKKLLGLSNQSGYEIKLNGDSINRLPNNINISVSGIKSELLVIELDALGICVSEKSACHSESVEPSYVIDAIRKSSGEKINQEEGSLRISLGRQTKKEDINYLVVSLQKILEKYKKWK